MQQLVIDISSESPAGLRLAAQFLSDHASLKEAMERGDTPSNVIPFPSPPASPAQGVTAPVAPPAPTMNSTAPPPPPPPPPMNAPTAATPGTSSSPQAPSAPAMSASVAPVSPAVSGAPHVDEYDKAGVPWDARIHQRTKGQKKDGTWKLQKGIADSLVTQVMQELAPRIFTPSTAGASAPVSLQPAQPGAAPPPPPPPPVPNGAPAAPLEDKDPYRVLVAKISAARKAGQITPEEVTQCVTQAGAPSLQLLNNMPHFIPAVETNIDALLATR